MIDKNDTLSKVFRKRLKDYESEPDAGLWSGIEAGLNRRSGKRIRLMWKRISAVAAAAILILVCLIHWNNRGMEDLVVKKEGGPKTEKPEKNQVIGAEKQPQIEVVESLRNERKNEAVYPAESGIRKVDEVVMPVQLSDERNDDRTDSRPDTPNESGEEIVRPDVSDMPLVADTSPEEWDIPVEQGIKKDHFGRRDNQMALAVGLGNSGANFLNTSDISMMSLADRTSEICSDTPLGNDYYSQIEEESSLLDTDYSIPISVGFYVRKNFSEKWAIESGLSYTYLASEETWQSKDKSIYKKDLDLHYVGIPVKMVYSIYDNKLFSVYASGGGMLEKCISGKEKIYTDTETNANSIHVSELQWSLAGSVGFNLQLIKNLGFYIEPGVFYYLDDHSDIKTIRKDSPFNFQVQAGIRLNY